MKKRKIKDITFRIKGTTPNRKQTTYHLINMISYENMSQYIIIRTRILVVIQD